MKDEKSKYKTLKERKENKEKKKKMRKNFVAINLKGRYQDRIRGIKFLKKHRKGYRKNYYLEQKKQLRKERERMKNPDRSSSDDSRDLDENAYEEAKNLIECKFLTKNLWNDFWTEGNKSTMLNLLNNPSGGGEGGGEIELEVGLPASEKDGKEGADGVEKGGEGAKEAASGQMEIEETGNDA